MNGDRGPITGTQQSLRGQLKEAIRRLNTQETRKGVDVDAVIDAVTDRTEFTEPDARDTLERMLLEGLVYPPRDGRVRVTP